MKAKNYKPTGAFDAACFKWLGIPAIQASRIVVIGVAVGAMMETFMVKVWIGKTNCACCAKRKISRIARRLSRMHTPSVSLRTVYETVKKKEAERRRDEQSITEPRFADVLKQTWEAKKRELEAEKAAKSAG